MKITEPFKKGFVKYVLLPASILAGAVNFSSVLSADGSIKPKIKQGELFAQELTSKEQVAKEEQIKVPTIITSSKTAEEQIPKETKKKNLIQILGGNIEAISSFKDLGDEKLSYIRPNIFYKALGFDAYTWGEFYNNGGFLGRTSLTRKLDKIFDLAVEVNHGNELFSNAGVGLKAKIPISKDVSASIALIPLYMGKDGKIMNDKSMLEYFVNAKVGKKFEIGSFGEWNLNQGQWDYGEGWAFYRVNDTIMIGYNPALLNKKEAHDGGMIPDIVHRACLRINL